MLYTHPHYVASDWTTQTRPLINAHLDKLLKPVRPSPVTEAMRYSVLAPGKRVRPLLTLAVSNFLGVAPAGALHVACAIEMIHSASLILDDLPCMDNDRERRNRLATHVAFGEDLSILAAISLLMQSYSILASHETLTADLRVKLIQLLCETIGPNGLSLGQYIDLNTKAQPASLAAISHIHHLKTGVLFLAAAKAGCLMCDASPEQEKKIVRFTSNIGLAFQLMDDITDLDEARLNIAARMSASSAERKFLDYLRAANAAIEGEDNAAVLQDFAWAVFSRS
jgi:geranylgeranyl diphosphate synthase, type II